MVRAEPACVQAYRAPMLAAALGHRRRVVLTKRGMAEWRQGGERANGSHRCDVQCNARAASRHAWAERALTPSGLYSLAVRRGKQAHTHNAQGRRNRQQGHSVTTSSSVGTPCPIRCVVSVVVARSSVGRCSWGASRARVRDAYGPAFEARRYVVCRAPPPRRPAGRVARCSGRMLLSKV